MKFYTFFSFLSLMFFFSCSVSIIPSSERFETDVSDGGKIKESAEYISEKSIEYILEKIQDQRVICSNECLKEAESQCNYEKTAFQICQKNINGCLEWSSQINCPSNENCRDRKCICFNKTCNATCCLPEQSCYNNICCTPNCNSRQCGDDDCGGFCEPGCLNNEICQINKCVKSTLKQNEVFIPAGNTQVGSEKEGSFKNEGPIHQVSLTYPFALNKYKVTQEEFKDLMGYNPSRGVACRKNCPVENMNWYEALAFCNNLSKKENLPECFDCVGSGEKIFCGLKNIYIGNNGKDYYKCKGYRLPTEAEWEYAVRAGTKTDFYNGDLIEPAGEDFNLDKIAWYHANSNIMTHPIGQKAPNKWELYDMLGNVREWVFDYSMREYTSSHAINPIQITGSGHIIRGCHYDAFPSVCRVSMRLSLETINRHSTLGFRVCRSL